MSIFSTNAIAERENKVMELCYNMMGEIECDLNETKQSVVSTRKRNTELEKLIDQLTYENNRLKDKLSSTMQKLDEKDSELRGREMQSLAEAEESRQAAAGEIERALSSYRQAVDRSAQLEERIQMIELKRHELEQEALVSEQTNHLLQNKLTDANQLVVSLTRRLEESERHSVTLEAALSEIKYAQARNGTQ